MSTVTLPAQGWVPRWYQSNFWKFRRAGGRRAILCWPRRHGKDHCCLNDMAFSACCERVGAYYYIMPYQNQARRIVWNGIDKDGKRFIDAFPKEMIDSRSNAEMRLHLKNGSLFQVVGGDDPDKLVGANPVGLVFSEYALTNPMCWKLVSPILAENEGWVVFNSTPRGYNHFWKMLEHAKAHSWNHKSNLLGDAPPLPSQWFWSHESARTLKVLDAPALRQLRAELQDEALFQQEAFTSFETPLQGAYYQKQMAALIKNGRVAKAPVDPALPVHTGWDIGMNDSTAIWFAQKVQGDNLAIVGYYENSGEGLPHYISYLTQWKNEKMIEFGDHFAPHDINAREWLGDGKTRLEAAKEMGLRFRPVPRHSLEDGIEQVRKTLPRCTFDKEECGRGVDCMTSYRKEWDENLQAYKSRPLHDWASHGADAFRTLAMGLRRERKVDLDAEEQHYKSSDDEDFFSF